MSDLPEPSAIDLENLALTATPEQLADHFGELASGDVAHAFAHISTKAQNRVLTEIDAADAAELIGCLSDAQAVDLLENIEPNRVAAIVQELPSNEAADLLGEFEKEDAEAVLAAMTPEEAAETLDLAAYDDDVAGGLMITEVLSYPSTHTAADVIADLGEHAETYRDYDIQYAYVLDPEERLVGVLPLRELLLSRRSRRIEELMIRDPIAIRDDAPLDAIEDLFDRIGFFGVPVVDGERRLKGVVRRSAMATALGERAESDLLKGAGIVGGEELRTMTLWRRSSRRLAWLSVNIVLNIAAASVIALHQDTLSAVIALAVFLPIISDMSGCSGNQAVAVSMRELSLGIARPSDVFRVWRKEIAVGAINGLALGLLLGGVAWVWQSNAYLGLVVGSAMAVNTIVAVSIGGCIPLVLKAIGKDPALASGPILTTFTDMCGFFLVLGLAAAMIAQLTG